MSVDERVQDLYKQKKDIEEQIEYSTSEKFKETLEEELYNINHSIKLLTKGEKNGHLG